MARRKPEWKAERDRVIEARKEYAKKRFYQAGIPVVDETSLSIIVRCNCNRVEYFPYTGWFSGKGVHDGRGIEKLIAQCAR